MNQHNLFASTAAVFRFFFGKINNSGEDEFPGWLVPVAGLLPGVIFAVISAAFVFLMGPAAGGIITALCIPLVLELLTGWRGIILSVACFERIISGNKLLAEPLEKVTEKNQTELMQRQILFATLYLFRMAVFGMLAATGNAVWFVYILGGAYLIRGELLKENEDFETPDYGNWIFYGGFTLAAGILSFHWAALASLPLAWILTLLCLFGCRRLTENLSGSVESWMADLLGYLSENIMLLVGLILFGRFLHG